MADLEAPEGDALEQEQSVREPGAPGALGLDPEAPEADAVEQRTPLRPTGADPSGPPGEADEADVAEQARTVEVDDEDEYR